MAKQEINLGTPNGKDGDLIRDAFNKVNQNFTELYTLTGGTSVALTELAQDYAAEMFTNATHTGITVNYDDANNVLEFTGFDGNYNNLSNKPTLFDPSAVSQSIIPDTDVAYDLGSATNRFRDLYLSGNTIDLGGTTLSVVGGELQIGGTSLTETITASLATQGGLTSTLTVGADSQTGGLLYDSGGAQLISIQNPEGNFNTLTARATIAGGQVILEAREEINADTPTTALGQLTLNTGTFTVGVTTGLPGAGKEMIFTPDSLYLPVRLEHETDSNFVIRTSDYNAGDPIVNDFTFGINGNLTIPNNAIATNVIANNAFVVGPALDNAPTISSLVNGINAISMDLQIWSGYTGTGDVSGNLDIDVVPATTRGEIRIGNQGPVVKIGNPTQGQWTFGTDGTLTTPGGYIKPDATDGFLTIEGPLYADMVQEEGGGIRTITNGVKIRTHRAFDDLDRDWNFSWDGAIYTPRDASNPQVGAIEWRTDNITSQVRRTEGGTLLSGRVVPPGLMLFSNNTGAVSVQTGNGNYWTFEETGNLTLSNDSVIRADGTNVEVGNLTNFNVEANSVVNIFTDAQGAAHQWQFGDAGEIIFPDATVQTTAYTGAGTFNSTVPTSSIGQAGDTEGMMAADNTHLYRCVANYDGVSDIWVRLFWVGGTW